MSRRNRLHLLLSSCSSSSRLDRRWARSSWAEAPHTSCSVLGTCPSGPRSPLLFPLWCPRSDGGVGNLPAEGCEGFIPKLEVHVLKCLWSGHGRRGSWPPGECGCRAEGQRLGLQGLPPRCCYSPAARPWLPAASVSPPVSEAAS